MTIQQQMIRPGGLRVALVNEYGVHVTTSGPNELRDRLRQALQRHLPAIALSSDSRWGDTAVGDLRTRLTQAFGERLPVLTTRRRAIAALDQAFADLEIQFQTAVLEAYDRAYAEVDLEFRQRSLKRGSNAS